MLVLIRLLRVVVEETNARVVLHVAKAVLISAKEAVAVKEVAMTGLKEEEEEVRVEARIAVAEELTEVAAVQTVVVPEAVPIVAALEVGQIVARAVAQGKNRIE